MKCRYCELDIWLDANLSWRDKAGNICPKDGLPHRPIPEKPKFRVGVITVAGATPVFNSLEFMTKKEASTYAHDLMRRWTAVISTVIEEVPTSPEEGA